MKRFGILALVAAACVAGFAGSLLNEHLKPEAVEAQGFQRSPDGIRIALVNVQEAARKSKKFQVRKVDWERAQTELKAQNDKMRRDYEAKYLELNRARIAGEPEDVLLNLRIELQSIEEAMKAAEGQQKEYLMELLNQYQNEVLQNVMKEIKDYTDLQGYDIVLQDYSENPDDADFLSNDAYSQTIMSKPVIHTPLLDKKQNKFVKDITQVIIDRLENAPVDGTGG